MQREIWIRNGSGGAGKLWRGEEKLGALFRQIEARANALVHGLSGFKGVFP